MRVGPVARWEVAAVVGAVCLALVLGLANLGGPNLWHDELVHVYAAKSIVATGRPALPSGRPYLNGVLYNYVLAAFVACIGDGEAAVRLPSVLLAGVNVLLTFLMVRPLLGRAPALAAAVALAVCPWTVAWSREARFYTLQQSTYMVALVFAWRATEARGPRAAVGPAIGAAVACFGGLLASIHSILFLGPLGAYAFLMGLAENRGRARWALCAMGAATAAGLALCLLVSVYAMAALLAAGLAWCCYGLAARRFESRWTFSCCLVALAIGLILLGYFVSLPQADHDAVFKEGGLSGTTGNLELDRDRSDALYYVRFYTNNLSTGFFALALIGFGAMLVREGRRGLFVALAFWAPVLFLSYLGYRRFRFMFFAFPCYVAACSYGGVALVRFCRTARRSWLHAGATALIVLFLLRLSLSAVYLIGDSVEVARGAAVTLARRHPQWREPCRYVRERIDEAARKGTSVAVVSTTYLPTLYYLGRCDEWYPSRTTIWEYVESDLEGLETLEDLQAFMAEHPRGYFLAEYRRFGYVKWLLADDIAWVGDNMTRVADASNEDITVFAWGIE